MADFLWQRTHEGYLMVDHRASPGLPPDVARKMGYQADAVGEGTLYEAPTLGCPHCGACVVLNPDRKRPRNHCQKCHRYICDGCAQIAAHPDYVHRTFAEMVDMVQAGKVAHMLATGTTNTPMLIPIGGPQNG
jgi:hypothetical protein